MLKQNKLKLIIVSIITLLPIVLGIIKDSAILIVMPLVFFAVGAFCVFATHKDPSNKDQNSKVLFSVYIIIPLISIYFSVLTVAVEYNHKISPIILTTLLLAGMAIIIGNYLPKCKQNLTIGIKIKWTLENEENWNKTHRFAGKLWFFGGIILALCVFLPENIQFFVFWIFLAAIIILPTIYSFADYKKRSKDGTYTKTPITKIHLSKKAKIVSTIACIILVIIFGILSATGSIEVELKQDFLYVNATYWSESEINYSDIEWIEYRESCETGTRVGGYGGFKVQLGNYKNEEFGNYIRYCYTNTDECIIIGTEKTVYIINCENTKAIYDKLMNRFEE